MEHGELRREISKLIAAIERAWKEELGAPEAHTTEIARKKAHRLLTQLNRGETASIEAPLSETLGFEWLESHPWASPYVSRIDRGLARMRDKP